MTDAATVVGRVRDKRPSRKKTIKVHEKVEKSQKHVFQMCCGFGGSKSRLAKESASEPFGGMRLQKVQAAVAQRCAKHISKSKCAKHFEDVQRLEQFWQLTC